MMGTLLLTGVKESDEESSRCHDKEGILVVLKLASADCSLKILDPVEDEGL
jgi:hypothetical protein